MLKNLTARKRSKVKVAEAGNGEEGPPPQPMRVESAPKTKAVPKQYPDTSKNKADEGDMLQVHPQDIPLVMYIPSMQVYENKFVTSKKNNTAGATWLIKNAGASSKKKRRQRKK